MTNNNSNMEDKPQVYGAIFITPQSKILVVKGKPTGKWSFPKGHPNENESPFDCAKRETFEEVNLELPRNYERLLFLATGSYYLVRSPELVTKLKDKNEILEIRWMTYAELRDSDVNVDVNTFLRNYRELITPKKVETPSPKRALPKPMSMVLD
jgi:ADP-ribose pyrophosphatase YjhB (NUDIX family)